MLRRSLCILLTLCLLAGYAAAEDSATAAPTQEPPEGALVNGMVDGSGESAVQEMQERLIALGLLTGAADGHFGDGTEEAVKLFQQMYGLEATGYADEATLAALSTDVYKRQVAECVSRGLFLASHHNHFINAALTDEDIALAVDIADDAFGVVEKRHPELKG